MSRLIFLLIGICVICSIGVVRSFAPPLEEQEALRDLIEFVRTAISSFHAFSISGWPKEWNASLAHLACDEQAVWPGIWCDSTLSPNTSHIMYVGHIFFISDEVANLTAPALKGTIPESVGNFTSLVSFQLPGQAIFGQIPASLFKLPNLGQVRLEYNFLTGPLPEEYSDLIVNIFVNNNRLSGTLPEALANLQNLKELKVNNNDFECPLSEDWVRRIATSDSERTTPGCAAHENKFELLDGKICGIIPQLVAHNCSLFPQKAVIPPALSFDDQATHNFVEHAGIYLELSSNGFLNMLLRQGNGKLFTDQYIMMNVLGVSQGGYFAMVKPTGAKFIEKEPGKYSLNIELTDGMMIEAQFHMFTNEANLPQLKVGWIITNHNFPSSTAKFRFVVQLAVKMPLDDSRAYGCQASGKGLELEDMQFLGRPFEFVLSNCTGNKANVLSKIVLQTAEPVADFSFSTEMLRISMEWATYAHVDGIAQFLDIPTSAIYVREENMDSALIGRARRYGIDGFEPTPLPTNEQYLNALLQLQYPVFQDSVVYDPDIRFQLLFGDDEEVAQMGWIAGPVIGVAVVAVVGVILLSPKARAKVFPFAFRSDKAKRIVELQDQGEHDDEEKRSSAWVAHNPDRGSLKNAK